MIHPTLTTYDIPEYNVRSLRYLAKREKEPEHFDKAIRDITFSHIVLGTIIEMTANPVVISRLDEAADSLLDSSLNCNDMVKGIIQRRVELKF